MYVLPKKKNDPCFVFIHSHHPCHSFVSPRYCRRAALKRMTRDIKEDADEERRINSKKSDGMDNVFLGNDRRVL